MPGLALFCSEINMTDWGYALVALVFFVAAIAISFRLRRAPRPWPVMEVLFVLALLVFAIAFLGKTSSNTSTAILVISIACAIVGSLLLVSAAAMLLLAALRRRRGGR
jgi:heme A synthase